MMVYSYMKVQQVGDDATLAAVLEARDERGGAEFWLSEDIHHYPCLAIVVSGNLSHIHYFPQEGHPGYRCLNDDTTTLVEGESTTLIWVGCDPGDGEQVPNEFVVPFPIAVIVAKEFMRQRSLPKCVQWFEL